MNKSIRLKIILLAIAFGACTSNAQFDHNARIDELIQSAAVSDSVGDLNTSIKHYSAILQLDSTNLIALNNRARAYVWTGHIEEGFSDYDKMVKLYPHEKTYSDRGLAHLMVKNYTSANADFASALLLNPKFGEAYYGLILIRMQEKKYEDAMKLCTRADSLDYNPGISHQVRADIYKNTGNFEAEIRERSESIKLDSGDANSMNYNNRGLAKNKIHDFAGAISDFNTAIDMNPRQAYAYNNRAYSYLQLSQLDDALASVQQSLKLDDKNSYAYRNRAEIYVALNEKEKACDDLKTALLLCNDEALSEEIMQLTKAHCRH